LRPRVLPCVFCYLVVGLAIGLIPNLHRGFIRIELALALLVTWVLADDHDSTVATDDLALVANLLDAWVNLHVSYFFIRGSFEPAGYGRTWIAQPSLWCLSVQANKVASRPTNGLFVAVDDAPTS